ncbi:hypothetical protein L195_g042124 [Trifolium pratense]|uniref:Uncharacterized protein n=2 Tax=Trifolium pratense TaxID=57577 RepID=A0ACB0JNP0_TRIPR|nr:hypothetical protein L195_g042124 [Trifolium pratense]CAJ2645600.1 unnamed protein product [Trifolium pratense]
MNRGKEQSHTTKDCKALRALGRGRIKKPAFKPAYTRLPPSEKSQSKEVKPSSSLLILQVQMTLMKIMLSSSAPGSLMMKNFQDLLRLRKKNLRHLSFPVLIRRMKELRNRVNPKWLSCNIQPFLSFLEHS